MSTTGQDVLNVVYQHLGAPSNLLETAYFGLRYLDSTHQPVPISSIVIHMMFSLRHIIIKVS